MTAAALRPSEITFTCPPWCSRTREEHLEDVGNHGGRVIHASKDQVGPGGWVVALNSLTYPDGTLADELGVTVNVEAGDLNLTPDQTRALVQALISAAAEAQR